MTEGKRVLSQRRCGRGSVGECEEEEAVNFRKQSKVVQELRHNEIPLSLLYPPEWHKLKSAFTSTALTPVKLWLFVIPFIAGLVSIFPIEIVTQNIEIEFGGKFQAPFSVLLSYIGAVSYMAAYALFSLRCPDFVKSHAPKFDKLPETTTRTEITDTIRKFTTGCLPNRFKTKSGKFFTRRAGRYYLDEEFADLEIQKVDTEHAAEFQNFWKANADYTAEKLFHENGSRLTPLLTECDLNLYDVTDFNEEIHPLYGTRLNEHLFNLIFVSSLRILQKNEDRNLIASLAYTALYTTLSEARAISRFFVYLLTVFSAGIGVFLVVQIVVRGFTLFYFHPS